MLLQESSRLIKNPFSLRAAAKKKGKRTEKRGEEARTINIKVVAVVVVGELVRQSENFFLGNEIKIGRKELVEVCQPTTRGHSKITFMI